MIRRIKNEMAYKHVTRNRWILLADASMETLFELTNDLDDFRFEISFLSENQKIELKSGVLSIHEMYDAWDHLSAIAHRTKDVIDEISNLIVMPTTMIDYDLDDYRLNTLKIINGGTTYISVRFLDNRVDIGIEDDLYQRCLSDITEEMPTVSENRYPLKNNSKITKADQRNYIRENHKDKFWC